MAATAIVLVDDESEIVGLQQEALAAHGLNAEAFSDPVAAWQRIQQGGVALVISDWNMPQMTGMDLLFKTRGLDIAPHFILLTAYGTIDRAVQAMNHGAFSFLEKPYKIDNYIAVVKDALQRFEQGQAKTEPQPRRTTKLTANKPIVVAPVMRGVYEQAASAAQVDSSILLLGESGSGKEVLVDYIHQHSKRAKGPLVKVNCGALPEHLMESELFGHEQGAFTGATKRNIGRFEQAQKGTLFLDEVGDLLLPLQVKLLRALQERTIERLGSSTPIAVDLRLVCATHRDLKALVAEGRFREDLYYRINVIPLRLPPLRERREDIAPLATYFLDSLVQPGRKLEFGREAIDALQRYNWPGNVRQLRNAVEYALVLCRGDKIQVADLPEDVRHGGPAPVVAVAPSSAPAAAPAVGEPRAAAPNSADGLRGGVQDAEGEIIRAALERHRWKVVDVARELKISRSSLYQKMKILGIHKP